MALAAALDQRKRERKQEETAAVMALRQRWDAACIPLDRLCDGSCLVLRAVRLVARAQRALDGDANVNAKSEDVIEELRELVELGETDDKSVIPRVRHLLDQHADIADHFGDAAKIATELWLALYAGNSAILTESTRRKMVLLKVSIAGPVPEPLETLLVEHVVVCWLQMHATEALHAQAHQEKASDAVLRERQRQTEVSQKLYGSALKQLAELRKWLRERAVDPLIMPFPVLYTKPGECGEQPTDAASQSVEDVPGPKR